jgi:hypothetical protein
MFKRIDPTMLPDGLCWSVVETLKTGACQRTRFVTEREAREYANSVVRDGVMVYIEGPESNGDGK